MTSPLTTLGTISTPDSFYTARDSSSIAADETSLSSPVEPPEDEEPRYRDAVQLPRELKSHCQIHLEEQLYTAAIHILSGLLSDGSSTTATPNPSCHLPPPPPPPPPSSSSLQQRHHATPPQRPQTPHTNPPRASKPGPQNQARPQPQKAKPKPALVPPPSQLALLATLFIHPSFTSRATEQSNLHAAAHACAYLKGLLGTVGPVNANFRAALAFGGGGGGGGGGSGGELAGGGGRGWGGGSRSGSEEMDDDDDNDDDDDDGGSPLLLGGPFGGRQRQQHQRHQQRGLLFRRGGNFWAVLGWAFRCAAEFPARWRHWRVWLDFVVAALEADWDERLRRDHEGGRTATAKAPRPYPVARASLVVAYLEDLSRERRNALREVCRALFAFASDGGDWAADRAVFREVFERETVVARGKSKRKRVDAVVDLENDQFGDYLDGDEFESEEEDEGQGNSITAAPTLRNRRKPGMKPKGEGTAVFSLTDAIAETVPFRLRIFRLLSAVSFYLPDTFVPVSELYERFTDNVRALPLPMFKLFVDSHPPILPETVHVSMVRVLIEALLPKHPDPAEVDPDGDMLGHGVTMCMMEKCFLPFAANKVTAEDNAKLSLVLENLLGFMYSQIEVEYSDGLRRAVEKGIKAREDKIKKRSAASKADAADKAAREVLARSARNLKVLLEIIAVTGQ
ncbi:hypothetical protein VTK26DRAFT_5865 [Humicola hyalothermophila]